MSARLVVFALCLPLGLSCSAFRQRATAPRIQSVVPDSAVVAAGSVVEIIVNGRDFAPGVPGRNTVHFGSVTITNIPAGNDGKQLRFVIPERVPSGGDAAPLPLEAGPYAISVETAGGMSNSMVVRVFR